MALGTVWGWASCEAGSTDRFEFKFPRPEAYEVIAPAAPEPDLRLSARSEWVEGRPIHDPGQSVLLGRRIVLQLWPGELLEPILATRPLEVARVVAPDLWILQAPDARIAVREAATLASRPEVQVAHPLTRRRVPLDAAYASSPTDSLFAAWDVNIRQWPLENRDESGTRLGVDLNIRSAWPYTLGDGVTLAVADCGVELDHQELAPRTEGVAHFNFTTGLPDGRPAGDSSTWAHGTEVAGLAVATRNTERMVGVAPEARLASWVIYDNDLRRATEEQLMEMFQHALDSVGVQNHSWSAATRTLSGPSALEQVALSNAFNLGRQGKGVILVRSAGNDRAGGANANEDAYSSDPRGVTVAAVREEGRVTSYSEPGACILVGAPSSDFGQNGLLTTDLKGTRGANFINFLPPDEDLSDYVFYGLGFSGTSAATPHIAGLAALLLAANQELTRRDVQQILALSARHFDFLDPDVSTNAAGFILSHNVGFGVPDAGEALRLARGWPNRPPAETLTFKMTGRVSIPDGGLRVETSGKGVPPELLSINALPSVGPHPDEPTAALQLVDVGEAADPITADLTGRGALILRGTTNFSTKIGHAAAAGAAFAVVYNYPTNATTTNDTSGGDVLLPMGATDFVPIPAVFIGHTAGNGLRNLAGTNAAARTRLIFHQTNITFAVTNTLACEHVGVRLKTDHTLRGDLRISLESPSGTLSVLQRYNSDTSPGPADWTYWSTHHWSEPTAGQWTLWAGDELEQGRLGDILEAELIVVGVPLEDNDHDGLDDSWETALLGSLAHKAVDDPDDDGFSNAREQLMGTDPAQADRPLVLDLSIWNPGSPRLSWPGRPGWRYEIWSGENVEQLWFMDEIEARLPETEWFPPPGTPAREFYRVIGLPDEVP